MPPTSANEYPAISPAHSAVPLLHPELAQVYEPLAVLGYGAFAMVIHAVDRRTGQQVAVKHFQARKGERKSFFRELKFMLALKHRNITRCLDVFNKDDHSCDIIFEYADGGSLREQMPEGRQFELREALDILVQVARGLAHAHSEGIVHRDLKPENILLFNEEQKRRYKLTDFGIAKFIGSQAQTFTSIGSPAYMAPEQFYDSYGFKTDIYALGVLLYELTHGQLPFSGSPAVIFKGHLEAEPQISAELDGEVAEMIRFLMAKKEVARPSAEEALELFVEQRARFLSSSHPDVQTVCDESESDANPEAFNNPEALFGDMFGGTAPRLGPAPAAAIPSAFLPAGDDSLALFGDAVGLDEDPPVTAPPWAGPAPEASPFGPPPSLESEAPDQEEAPPLLARHETSSDVFSEGFEDARVDEVPVTGDLQELAHAPRTSQFGRLALAFQWSRAVDTKAQRLLNTDDQLDLLVLTSSCIYELSGKGNKGPVVLERAPEVVGTPSSGSIPLVSDGQVRVMSAHRIVDQHWYLDAEVNQLVISPALDAVVVTVGHNVCYHDAQGNHRWTGRFDDAAQEIFISFDRQGRLMVLAIEGKDHGVHFYDAEGEEIISHWLPGRILAATRCRSQAGAWVVVERRQGFQLFRVAVEGISLACSLKQPLTRLVGGYNWVAGQDEHGRLWVIDSSTGACEVATVAGRILDYEQGNTEDMFFVLEARGEVLKYISAFSISGLAAAEEVE